MSERRSQWDPATVRAKLRERGVPDEIAQLFQVFRVSGDLLTDLDTSLLTELGVKSDEMEFVSAKIAELLVAGDDKKPNLGASAVVAAGLTDDLDLPDSRKSSRKDLRSAVTAAAAASFDDAPKSSGFHPEQAPPSWLADLDEFECFVGAMSVTEAEQLLAQERRGKYLVRIGSSGHYVISLVPRNGGARHTRIVRNDAGQAMLERKSVGKVFAFSNLAELIKSCRREDLVSDACEKAREKWRTEVRPRVKPVDPKPVVVIVEDSDSSSATPDEKGSRAKSSGSFDAEDYRLEAKTPPLQRTGGPGEKSRSTIKLILTRYKPQSSGLLMFEISKTVVDILAALHEHPVIQPMLQERLRAWQDEAVAQADAEREKEQKKSSRQKKKSSRRDASKPEKDTKDTNDTKDTKSRVARILFERMIASQDQGLLVQKTLDLISSGHRLSQVLQELVSFLLEGWGFRSKSLWVLVDHAVSRQYESLRGFGSKVRSVSDKVALALSVMMIVVFRDILKLWIDGYVCSDEVFLPRLLNPDHYARFAGALYEAQLAKFRGLSPQKKRLLVHFALSIFDVLSSSPNGEMLELQASGESTVPEGLEKVCSGFAKHFDRNSHRFNQSKYLPGFDLTNFDKNSETAAVEEPDLSVLKVSGDPTSPRSGSWRPARDGKILDSIVGVRSRALTAADINIETPLWRTLPSSPKISEGHLDKNQSLQLALRRARSFVQTTSSMSFFLNICEPDTSFAMQLSGYFCDHPAVQVFNESFSQVHSALASTRDSDPTSSVLDCLIIFGNSTGLSELKGSIAEIRRIFGDQIVNKIARKVQQKFLGEMPIGSAFVMATENPLIPTICYSCAYHEQAPSDGYTPFWGALVAISRYNATVEKANAKRMISGSSMNLISGSSTNLTSDSSMNLNADLSLPMRLGSLRDLHLAAAQREAQGKPLIRVICTSGLSLPEFSFFESSRQMCYAWQQLVRSFVLEDSHEKAAPEKINTAKEVELQHALTVERIKRTRFATSDRADAEYAPNVVAFPMHKTEGPDGRKPVGRDAFQVFLARLRSGCIRRRSFTDLAEVDTLVDVMLAENLDRFETNAKRFVDEAVRIFAAEALAAFAFPREKCKGASAAVLKRSGAIEYMLEMAVNAKITVHDELDDPMLLTSVLAAVARGEEGEEAVREQSGAPTFDDPVHIFECVYSGIASRVYRAMIYDAANSKGTTVAIKASGDRFLGFDGHSFVRETAIISMLTHPNIVECIGAHIRPSSAGSGLLISVQEWLPMSLGDLLDNEKIEVNSDLRLAVAVQVACAVSYLHSMKIVHRDVKTSNVMMATSPPYTSNMRSNVKLIDLGCSEILVAPATDKSTSKFPANYFLRTANPSVDGTAQYLAPEVFSCRETGAEITDRVDTYAFGVVLWELITRAEPWCEVENRQIANLVLGGQRLKMPEHAEPWLAALIESCWDEPRKRPCLAEVLHKLQTKAEEAHVYVI